MNRIQGLVFAAVLMTGAVTAGAQQPPSTPGFSAAEWRPQVGQGAVYEVHQGSDPPMDWEITVVGIEGDAHWIEMTLQTADGQMVVKSLMSPKTGVKRSIMKLGNEPAMEFPMLAAMTQSVPEDVRSTGQRIGQESVTVPAGTFSCEHYRATARGETVDAWLSTSVSPYGVVKSTSPKATMLLKRVISGARTKITETPQSVQVPGLDGLLGGKGGGMPQLQELLGDQN